VVLKAPPQIITAGGAPPERHAKRVVGEWIQILAHRNAVLWDVVQRIAQDPHTRDGSPGAQRKLEAQVKRAGADHTILETGGHGNFSLCAFSWVGWDPIADRVIKIDDIIPEHPWLAHFCYEIKGLGGRNRQFSGMSALMISHHVLQRCVER
jgi:hypothetical protein